MVSVLHVLSDLKQEQEIQMSKNQTHQFPQLPLSHLEIFSCTQSLKLLPTTVPFCYVMETSATRLARHTACVGPCLQAHCMGRTMFVTHCTERTMLQAQSMGRTMFVGTQHREYHVCRHTAWI